MTQWHGNPTPFYLRLVGWTDLRLHVDKMCPHDDNDEASSPPTPHPRYQSCYRGYEHHITLHTPLHCGSIMQFGVTFPSSMKPSWWINKYRHIFISWYFGGLSGSVTDCSAEATVFILLWSKVVTRIFCSWILTMLTQHGVSLLHNWHGACCSCNVGYKLNIVFLACKRFIEGSSNLTRMICTS